MRGRKPIPSALKVIRGNPGRRPINEHEPRHASIDRGVPDELIGDTPAWIPLARGEWARIIDTVSRGHVLRTDRASMIAYCLIYGQWIALTREAAAQPFVVHAASGSPIANPVYQMANRAMRLLLVSAAECGFTPSARSRIIVQSSVYADDPDDPFTRFQNQRKRDRG